jgi:hypothetical protein
VPFSDAGSCIALRLKFFCERNFIRMEYGMLVFPVPRFPDTDGIAAGHQGCPRWTTYGLRIEIGKQKSLFRHPVYVRGFHPLAAIAAEVPVSLVIRQDDDEIGPGAFLSG